ncbi:4Fe-4S binding protein [Agarivorans albus]
MLREIIEIDEALCDGCGQCVPACHEGALQIIDQKARLISDLMCDGLGACLGHCPTGAMTVVKREASAYDERKVMENIIQGGPNVIKAHLEHMLEHQEFDYYQIALQVLAEQGIEVPSHKQVSEQTSTTGCPGKKEQVLVREKGEPNQVSSEGSAPISALSHWPIQLHLINSANPVFVGADLLLAADCSAFAAADFHSSYLEGKKLLIACPKLDENQDAYVEKLNMLIRYGQLKSLTILRMEVPCCGGLSKWVKNALAKLKQPLESVEITINKVGEVVATKAL